MSSNNLDERIPLLERNRELHQKAEYASQQSHDVNENIGQDDQHRNDESRFAENNEERNQRLNEDEDDDSGSRTRQRDCCIWFLMILLCIIFSQTISFLLLDYSIQNLQILLIVFMIFAVINIVFMTWHRRIIAVAQSRLHGMKETMNDVVRNSLSLVGISFFYPFAAILDIFYLITSIMEVTRCDQAMMVMYDLYSKYMFEGLYRLMRLIFTGAELIFCWQFHNMDLRKKSVVRFGLVVVMAVNFGIWFVSLIDETIERQENTKNVTKMTKVLPPNISNATKECLQETLYEQTVLSYASRYLFPFPIEFTLLVGEFLFAKFITNKQIMRPRVEEVDQSAVNQGQLSQSAENQDQTTENRDQAQRIEVSSQRIEVNPQRAIRQQHQNIVEHEGDAVRERTGKSLLIMIFILSLAICANIINFVIGILAVFHEEDKRGIVSGQVRTWSIYYESYTIFYLSLVTLFILIAFCCSGDLENQPKKFKGIDFLMLFTGFASILYELIYFTAVCSNHFHHKNNRHYLKVLIFIISELINVVQIIVQIPFIFYCDRVQFRSVLRQQQRERPSETQWSGEIRTLKQAIFRDILLILAISNVTMWVVDSITWTDVTVKWDLSKEYFYADTISWNFFDGFFLPFEVFFRFNSFLLFLRAFIGFS